MNGRAGGAGDQTAIGELFMQGGRQVVCLPEEIHFKGSAVRVRREGQAVILEPMASDQRAVEAVWAEIDALRGGESLFEQGGFVDPPCAPDLSVDFDR